MSSENFAVKAGLEATATGEMLSYLAKAALVETHPSLPPAEGNVMVGVHATLLSLAASTLNVYLNALASWCNVPLLLLALQA